MKNSGVVAVMTEILPDCEEGRQHEWITVKRPPDNRGGWHIRRCEVCGLIYQYDTSD